MFEGQALDERRYTVGYEEHWKAQDDGSYRLVEQAITAVAPVMRRGKTGRDRDGYTLPDGRRQSPSWGNRLANQAVRSDYYRTVGERGGKRPPFPTETCNGRDTRRLRAGE